MVRDSSQQSVSLFGSQVSERFILSLCAITFVLIALYDVLTPRTFVVSILFIIPVFISLRLKSQAKVLTIGLIATVLIFLGYVATPSGKDVVEAATRGMDVLSIWIIVLVGMERRWIEMDQENATKQLEMRNRELSALEEISKTAISTLELDQLCSQILASLLKVTGADSALLSLKEGDRICRKVGIGIDLSSSTDECVGVDEDLPGAVATRLGPIVIEDVHSDPRAGTSMRKRGTRSALGVPMVHRGELIGVIEIDWLQSHNATEHEISLLSLAADRSAAAIVNSQFMEKERNDRIQTEESVKKLDAERQRLRTILNTLPVGVLVVDAQAKVVEANRIFETNWGGELPMTEGIEDLSKFRIWRPGTNTPLSMSDLPVVQAARFGTTMVNEPFDIQRFDGSRGRIIISAAPIKDAEGHVLGAVAASQDVTIVSRLERQARETKERTELYIDILTHDITNYNSAIAGYLQLAIDGEVGEKERQWITRSLEALRGITDLIQTLERIQRTFTFDEVSDQDLGAILNDSIESHENVLARKVTINYAPVEGYFVSGSPILHEVFASIIGNAIKHSTGPLVIDVSIDRVKEQGRDMYRISIEDNGPGIPDSAKSKVFSRLQRGTTKGIGSGLGLFLVKRMVEDLDGNISVEDRVHGDHSKGSRFVVTLPPIAARGTPSVRS